MIFRYSLPEMAELWSDQARYATWAKVEVLASAAQARLGRVPESALADIRRAQVPSAARVAELERERDHEILSFLAAFCEDIPDESARWVHLGMTSYDLVDTALGYSLARACDLLIRAATRLRGVLVDQAVKHWDTVCIGRTHGMHAEPTTFGHKLAGFAFAIDRSIRRLEAARQEVAVGTISGSVGTYALIDPFVEEYVCAELGLGVEPAPSQVVARDRHAQLLQAVATLGACIEQIATEVRLLSRSEVREVEESRTAGYQGSSAMPHKRNPTTSERLVGLARLLRGYAGTMLENVALWHERDLSHSSVERVVLPDAMIVAHYQTTAAADLVAALEVFPDRMRAAIDQTNGLAYSSAVLADLLAGGTERERAYRAVQAAANGAITGGEDFSTLLRAEGVDIGPLKPERCLVHHDVIFKRLETLVTWDIRRENGVDLDLNDVLEVYRSSGLGERRPVADIERMAAMLRYANLVLTCRIDGELVGIARSVSDFSYVTYLSDIAVSRAHQRSGIGRALIDATQKAAPQAKIVLLSAPAATGYYPHIGFTQHDSAWVRSP